MATIADDPRALARVQFTRADLFETGIDFAAKYATDPPLVIEGMMRAVAPAKDRWRLLEVGFGTGWMLELVAERYPGVELFGIDMSPSMVAAVRRKLPRAALFRGDMEAIPFGDRTFDCAVSSCALYFARDIEHAIGELARVTRAGGRVVMYTVGRDNIREVDELSYRIRLSAAIDDVAARFDLSSGLPIAKKIFPDAVMEEWTGTMTLPDARTFVQYWAMFHHREVEEGGPALLERALRAAQEFARPDGSVVLTRHSGVFIATV